MAEATAAQISADVTKPTYEVQLWTGATWTSVIANVERVAHSAEASGDLAGFAFGAQQGMTAEVTIDRALFSTAWQRRRIRIGYGLDTSDKAIAFVGVITGRSRTGTGGTWRCEGLDALARSMKLWSPLFRRRPIATATGATSIEDPTNPAYKGGAFNWIMWQCGGRPEAQAGTYPSAVFYYSAEQALIAPEWYWVSGENPWAELDRLCRACGGQVFQDAGVVRYVSPTGLALANPLHIFSDAEMSASDRAAYNIGQYEAMSEEADTAEWVTGVTCTYTERLVQGYQEVYADTEVRQVNANTVLPLTLETQLPIYDPARMRVEADGGVVRTGALPSAAQLAMTITSTTATQFGVSADNNLTTEPIVIYGVRLFGRPISAGEQGTASYSATGVLETDRTLEIPDNPLIQTRSHAERLVRMVFDFHSGDRGLIKLTGCPYDPRRYLGEPVYFVSEQPQTGWGEPQTICRIVAIRPTGDGFMDVDLGRAEGLPTRNQFFIIGSTYANSDVRQLSY